MSQISFVEKEDTALATLQRAIEKYSESHGVTFEEALMKFSCSGTYEQLFDFDSLLWMQGPDYLICQYEMEMAAKGHAKSHSL